MTAGYFLRGLLIGLAFGVPAGAIGALTIQRTLEKRFFAGLVTGTGSSVADLIYSCIGENQYDMRFKVIEDTGVKERMRATLDIVLRNDQYYQSTLTEQDKAFEQLDKIGLSKQQKNDVDSAISANNAVGAAYGAVAYRLGMQDGIRLVSELREMG